MSSILDTLRQVNTCGPVTHLRYQFCRLPKSDRFAIGLRRAGTPYLITVPLLTALLLLFRRMTRRVLVESTVVEVTF